MPKKLTKAERATLQEQKASEDFPAFCKLHNVTWKAGCELINMPGEHQTRFFLPGMLQFESKLNIQKPKK
jgi:hypothetical protein